MNKKGFTLIELLAVIVILGIVTTIALTMGINIFDQAKDKEEQTFLDRLSNSIGDLITMYTDELTLINDTTRCMIDKDKPDGSGTITQSLTHYTIPLEKLEEHELVNKAIINPKNKVECTNDDVKIHVYKDTDLVTYYYVKMPCTDKVINTIPELKEQKCLPDA